MKYLKKYKIFEGFDENFTSDFIDLMDSLGDDENYKPLIRWYKDDDKDSLRDPNGWKDELYFPVKDLGSLQIILSDKDGKYNDMDYKSLVYLKEYYIDRLKDMTPKTYDFIIWINSGRNREQVTLSELDTIISDMFPEVSRIEIFINNDKYLPQ